MALEYSFLVWAALKGRCSIPTSLVTFNFSGSLKKIYIIGKPILSLPPHTDLLTLHIYMWCFLQQECIYPQLLYINFVHSPLPITPDVFPNPYHNWLLLPNISPAISQAKLSRLYFQHYHLLPNIASGLLFT